MKRFLKKVMEAVIGLILLIVGGAFVLNFLGAAAEKRSEEKAMAQDLTLAGYADLSHAGRDIRIAAAADAVGAADRAADFTSCMGEFAATKSPDLPFDDVFSWCDMERTNAPEKFTNHFNELDAKDLSITALSICEIMVKDSLMSPSSAKFAFVDPIARGRQRYLVSSTVDAQNAYGAMLRARYVCEIQHDGVGDPFELASWKTHKLVIE